MFLAYTNKNYLVIAFDSMIDKGQISLFYKNAMLYQMNIINNDFIQIPLKNIATSQIDKIVFQKGDNKYVRHLMVVNNSHNQ